MIQRKREQFKREIRRQQLDAFFKERREQLLEPIDFQQYVLGLYSRPLGKLIAGCVDSMQCGLRCQHWQSVESGCDRIFGELQQNAGEASGYLMAVSPAVSRMLKRVLENQESIGEDENEWRQLSGEEQAGLASKFLELLSLVSYREVREDYFRGLLAAFWLIFTCDIDIYEQPHRRLFDLVLLILRRMLSSRSRIVLSELKAIGLGQQLTRIAQYDMEHLSSQNEQDLLEIVHSYLTLESVFMEGDFSQKVNGKTILEMQKGEKEILLALCLSTIELKHEDSYYPALNSILVILERHEYLINFIVRFATPIAELVRNRFPRVQLKAVELVADLIYHDSNIAFDLMRRQYILDLLYEELQRHLKQPCEQTHRFVCIASNLLCNLTLTKNRNEQRLSEHSIWDLAYENIQPGSPLLPLLPAFEFFFEILPRQTAINFLEGYLASVGVLEQGLLEKREEEAIRRTVQRVYVKCRDFWPEEYEQRLEEMIQRNRLGRAVEDIMEDEQELHPL